KLGPFRDPKAIDLILMDDGKSFTARGIYSLEQGGLRLCISFIPGSKRPGEFKSDPAAETNVEVLERVAPEARASAGVRSAEEIAAILREWRQAERAERKARTPEDRKKIRADSTAKARRLAERCLRVAALDPAGPSGLAALCWAAARSPG